MEGTDWRGEWKWENKDRDNNNTNIVRKIKLKI